MKWNLTALVAAGVVMVLGASVLLALIAPRKRQVSWIWQCHTTLDMASGSLSASRTLNGDGQRWYDDDAFNWYGKDQTDAPMPISISWYGSWKSGSRRDGYVLAYLHDAGELPRNGKLMFRRPSDRGRIMSFEIPMSSNASDRHTASASFRLDDLLAFARDSDTLDWTYDNPLTSRKVDRSGSVDIAPLRQALDARQAAERALAAMQADYRTACRRAEYRPTIVY